jgi:hypothetical protein
MITFNKNIWKDNQLEILQKCVRLDPLTKFDYIAVAMDASSFMGTRYLNKRGFNKECKEYLYLCIKYQHEFNIDKLNDALRDIDLYKSC